MNQLNLKQITLASALALVGSFPVVEEAEGAIFVKIPGIKGDVITKGQEEGIAALSWAWNSASDGGDRKSASNLCMSSLSLGRLMAAGSAELMRHHSSGTRFSSIELVVTDDSSGAAGESRMVSSYEFFDAVISSFSVSGDEISQPFESVSFNYSGLRGTVYSYDDAGRLIAYPFEVGPNACQ